LLAAGDPRGILHLTYNAISRHPILGEDQTEISGWNDILLLRYAHLLSDECIDLLVDDIVAAPHWFHAEVLAAAPSSLVVPKLRNVLQSTSGVPAIQAAYALSLHGRSEAQDVLRAAIDDGDVRALEMGLIAFSRAPDEETVQTIRAVADGTHAIFGEFPGYFAAAHRAKESLDFRIRQYRRLAEQRLAVLETQSRFTDVVRRYYKKRHRDIWATKDWTRQANFAETYAAEFICIDHDKVTCTPDFLHEFSTDSDRQTLAADQRVAVNELLDRVPESDWHELSRWLFMRWVKRSADTRYLTHCYLDGVEVRCDREDYLFAATDWLLNPRDYRCGSVAMTRWDRMS
jgi:hypothetical protein